jgi:uncharacterized protein
MQTYTVARSSIISKVFLGLFISLITASLGVYLGSNLPPMLIGLLSIVELLMIIVAMFLQRRKNIGYGFVFAFTFISGITLYPIIASYAATLGPQVVIQALGATSVAFLLASFAASRTRLFDFTFLGGFLFIGLIALMVMGLVGMFTGFSTGTGIVYSAIGVVLFIGYILFDVSRLVKYGVTEQMVPWMVLSLYLDFVNLFLFILRLLGFVSDSRR